MKPQRSTRFVFVQLLLWYLLLGNKIGSTSEIQPQLTTDSKDEDKITDAEYATVSDDQDDPTQGPPPMKPRTTGDGGYEPHIPTTRLLPEAYTGNATTTLNSPSTTWTPATISLPHTSLVVTTPGVTTGTGTTEQSTTAMESKGTTQYPSTWVVTVLSQLTTTAPILSQRVTTATVSTTTSQSITTLTERTTTPTERTTTSGSTTARPLQTTHQPPPVTVGPQPTNQPLRPSHRPTQEPPPPQTNAPVETEKPPPSKPHKPTRPSRTIRPRPTTRRVTVPTKAPTTPNIMTAAPTTHALTPIAYPDIAIQLFLQTTWQDLCPGIGDLLSSLTKYSKTALSLSYFPDVGLLNDTSHCPRKEANKRDTPIDKIRVQVDVCILTKGLCDARLTERVGVQMQADVEELQTYLKPEVLSVRVYRTQQRTPSPHTTTKSPTGVAVGVSFSLLLMVSVVTIVAYKMYRLHMAKRRALHNRYYFDGKQLHDTLSEAVQLSPMQRRTFTMPVTVHQLVPAINEGLIMDDEEDLAAQKYPSHVLSMHALTQFHCYLEAIVEEFEILPDFQSCLTRSYSPSKAATATPSLFHPPPTTRVPLEKFGPDNQHGFLNASYIRGYGKSKYCYIATQAPWGNGLNDFWQMVWEQQSRTIICLCSPEEMGVVCPWYWPRDEGIQAAQLYGDILIMRQGCVLTENYTVSMLLIKNIQTSLCRPVHHFWFTQWPVVSNLVPSCTTALLSFLLQVRQTVQETYGPIITHCSDGCGRTGTLLAIDSGMRSMEDLCTVDVPSIVCRIRHDRGSAVLQRNHYAFIYKALYEYSVMLTRGLADGMRADDDGLNADTSTC